jgi:hypothetical protein
MKRRGFLQLAGAGIAGIILDQAIPLGRVWSFPTNIVLAKHVIPGHGLPRLITRDAPEFVSVREQFIPSDNGSFIQLIEFKRCDGSWEALSSTEYESAPFIIPQINRKLQRKPPSSLIIQA